VAHGYAEHKDALAKRLHRIEGQVRNMLGIPAEAATP